MREEGQERGCRLNVRINVQRRSKKIEQSVRSKAVEVEMLMLPVMRIIRIIRVRTLFYPSVGKL